MRLKFIKRCLVLPLVFIAGSIIAQPPPGINFQALAKDPLGNPAKNRTVYIKNIIYQTCPVGCTKVWEETHVAQADNDGIYTILIGQGTRSQGIPINGINEIDWANGPFFLNIKVAVAPSIPASWWVATDNYLDMGTQQMQSVPYALFAGNASVTNVNASIKPGPPGTFLITDTLGNVNWQFPQSANVNITQIYNKVLKVDSNIVARGQNAVIAANTTTLVKMDVPGAEVGDPVLITALGDYVNFNIYSAWVSKKNEVSIRFSNFQDREIPVSGSLYKIVLIK
ncbi:MAG: hypothetical protein Q8R50_10890 [Sediminibacterium sp.]|nr:hypothetical protein [Sediminibacterium sp.]